MSTITTDSSMDVVRLPPVNRVPCAVCEHLTRPCRRGCPFKLHFPGEKPTNLDILCRALGACNAKRSLEALPPGEWESEAKKMLLGAIVTLQQRVQYLSDVAVNLQSRAFHLQVDNAKLQYQVAARARPPQPQPRFSIYDLIDWGDGAKGNPAGGGQAGGPSASGPGGAGNGPGGQHGGGASSSVNNRRGGAGPF